MDCASEPDGIAAGTGALPGARRRCEAGKRTHGPGTRACLALLAATALLALAAPAQAQTAVLISNFNQAVATGPNTPVVSTMQQMAQGFTTGSSPATLTSIDLKFYAQEATTELPSMTLHSGSPTGTQVAILTSSGSLAAAAIATFTFTAPANTTLTLATTYFLVLENTGSVSIVPIPTKSDAEESGGATGWSIADVLKYRSGSMGSFTGDFLDDTMESRAVLISVNGTVGGTTNTPATGAPTITGTAQVGQTLTAVTTGILDADGLTSPTYTYQWIRVNGTEADIVGENSSTYTLGAADLAKTIKVKVSFDDDLGNTETLTSDATATVTGVVTNNPPVFNPATVTLQVDENTLAGENVGSPVAATDADSDTLSYTLEGADKDAFDIVSTSGQIRTKTGVTYDYEANASYSVSVKADDGSGTSNATATAAVTVAVGDVDEPPLAPDPPEVAGVPRTFDSLTVHWDPPGNAGRPAITGYDIRYARFPESFGDPDWEDGPRGVPGTTATLSDLYAGSLYLVAVRAINAEGESAWSEASGEYVFRPPSQVTANDTYVPSDLSFGDIYRILFVTIDGFPASTLRSANDRVIGAAGTPIKLLVSGIANTFRAVVSTRHVDARVNTGTTYTAADKGVPIYWANGGKVADDYEDFYDGDWDDEANARDEFGDLKALPDGVWTGSGHDGTELFDGTVSRAFGQGETGYGTPGSVTPGAGPLYSGSSADRAEERPLYGLSLELRVAFPLLASSVGSFEAELSDSAAARSQRFTTGGNLYGYELESIGVAYYDSQGDPLSAALYTVDSQGRPDTLVAPLAAPSVFGETLKATDHRFATPPGTVLDPGTTYAVVFRPETAGTDVRLQATAVDSEDPDGQADWSIADTFEVESAGSWQADADGRSLQIEVRGTVRTGLPGAPTGLGATKLGRYRIDLSWTAPAFDGNLPITGYRIEVSPDGVTDWTDLVLDTGSTDTADTHTPLAPSTTRHYRVSAINSAGTGDPSEPDDATTDPNTPPAFTVDAANVSVPENTPANTNISGANRTATDPDGDSVTYSFQTGGGVTQDYQSFNIDSGTGQVKTRSALDHEAQASYEVSVIATDIHGGIDTIAYSIAVGDAAEPPAKPDAPTVTATPGSTDSVDVSWAAPANTGNPPITGYDLQYRQGTSGNWTNGPQNVDTTSASIPGLDGNRPYDVQVRAKNDEGNSDWSEPGSGRTANNAPVLPDGPLTLTVPENTAADTNIGAAVGASDADSDPRAYTLEGPDAASFAIVETSGQIRVQAALDFEATNSYSVTVRASDGTDSDTVAVTIDVTDVDEPPVPPGAPAVAATPGTDDSLDVAWAAPANVGKPAITSYDLHYRPGTAGNWIDGPQDVATTSAAIPDLSPRTSYQVEVRATNAEGDSDWSSHGTGSTSGPLNSAPTFANPTVTLTLLENTPAGTNVGSPVAATDADTGDTLTYSLGGTDVASFAIVTSSGQIRTRDGVTYDFENKSSYSVSVTVTDQTANASASVTINLIDAAERPVPPGAPAVAARPGTDDSLDVSWTAPANAGKPAITSYDLHYRPGTSGNWINGPQNVVVTNAVIPSLSSSTFYQVEVRATNADGDSGWSYHGTGSTGISLSVITQVMEVRIVPGNAHLVVRWMAVDNATGYKVQWKSGVDYNTGDRQATVTSGLTTRYRIPNLTNGTEYTVRVIATRAGVNDGPPSAEVTATPDVVAPPPPPPPPQENKFPTADAGPDQSGLWEGALVMLDGSGSSHPEDEPLRYRWNQLSGEPVALSSQNVV